MVYALDHTAATYLVDRESEILLAYPYGTDPHDLVADLRQLTDASPTGNQQSTHCLWRNVPFTRDHAFINHDLSPYLR